MAHRRPVIGGNWKMNTDTESAAELAEGVVEGVLSERQHERADVLVFPPFVYISLVRVVIGPRPGVLVGAQDLYHEASGAFTGEVSAAMLKDVGATAVLTGHSERRHVLGESNELVNKKTRAALGAGMTCVLCIGEKLAERELKQTDQVNERQLRAGLAGVSVDQLAKVVIAYEPVWAIGTGRTATPADAQDAHAKIRGVLADMFGPAAAAATRIQYGGSVKASNADELAAQPDIDGFLVGGASLNVDEFCAIGRAACAARRR